MSRLLRRGVLVGAVAGLAYATWRFVAARASGSDGPAFEPQPFPMPPRPVAPRPMTAPPLVPIPDAVDPDADGNCPLANPIKGKLSTGIYHRPGAFAYDRTARTAATATTKPPKRTDCARPSAESRAPFPRRRADLLSHDHDEGEAHARGFQEVHHEGQRAGPGRCRDHRHRVRAVGQQLREGHRHADHGAVVGKPSFNDLTLGIGDGVIRYGSFLTLLVNFLIIAFVLFLIVQAAEKLQSLRGAKEIEEDPSEVDLLVEIRDLLREQRSA